MTDAIDDFHEMKELLQENGFVLRETSFDYDPDDDPFPEFSVEMTLSRINEE